MRRKAAMGLTVTVTVVDASFPFSTGEWKRGGKRFVQFSRICPCELTAFNFFFFSFFLNNKKLSPIFKQIKAHINLKMERKFAQ